MKTDIILAGVGGQGILSIAAVLGMAALSKNLYLKQAETHGMSQRGGAVVSHFRISEKPIASDLIPQGKADLILSVEPMEALRYLPYLKKDGHLITNVTPFVNIPNYPELQNLFNEMDHKVKNVRIDADQLAKEAGSIKASNMVMIGAASPFIQLNAETIEAGIRKIFESKGEDIVLINLEAFRLGLAFTNELHIH